MATKLSRLLKGLGRRRIKDWRDLPHWSKDAEYLRQKDEWANVRKGMAARRYNSYGNRYLRSLGLSVRLGGDGGGVLCSLGGCVENTQYGTPGSTKLLEYQFISGQPVQVATTGDFISFQIDQVPTFGSIVGGKYALRLLLRWVGSYPQGANCNNLLDTVLLGDFQLIGPIAITPPEFNAVVSNACGNWVQYKFFIKHHTNFVNGNFACPISPFARYVATEQSIQRLIAPNGLAPISGEYSIIEQWIRCNDGLPSDPPRQRITISDSTGVIHVGYGSPGDLADPIITISQAGAGAGFAVQSARYPQVFYSVPVNYSSCECGDFNQQVIKPDYAARSWVGTDAGGFNPCKHIMAVKRVLQIPQSFNDYVPYVKQYREDVPKPRYEQDNGRLDGYR